MNTITLSEITTFYLSTQGTINQLWEFFVVAHLAIVGWLVSVNDEHIQRARIVLFVFYSFLFFGLLFFFYEAYSELSRIHEDLLHILNQKDHVKCVKEGYFHHLINDVDIEQRKIRASIIFFVAWLATMLLLFLSIKKSSNEQASRK
jgi:Ca2+/Na+ antiporter